MNSIRISYLVLILCVSFVCANGFYLNYITDELCERAEEIDVDAEGAKARAEELYSFFDKHQRLISITVSHDDLRDIDNEICELIGALRVNDADGAEITKSRLCGSLRHLKRLSGLNIDSII